MSDAVLRFFPWMKRGLGRTLATEADEDGVPAGSIGVLDAKVTVVSTEVTRSIRVLGPGGVIGLASGQVIREDPEPDTTDFETNYFPAVELVSPDLPWMFTPAVANNDKLIPWLVLVVVEDRDGIELVSAGSRPLPSIRIDDAQRELPSLREAWAWAHVQASVAFTGDVEDAFDAQPEAFVARLVCPRRLTASTYYRACLVPSFREGLLSGLGLDSEDPDGAALSWSDTTADIELPVYHTWRFRTASEGGDFESLVKALTARTLDGSVGVHDLDVGEPGTTRLPEAPGTIVGFTGALVSPNVAVPEWPASHRDAFQPAMQALLNESLTKTAQSGKYDWRTDDPVVAPPAYGALPAGVDAVPAAGAPPTDAEPQWLSDVNLDPARRAAAGLGAEVVRRNQEPLVAAAWDQVEGIGSVNRLLNRSRLALEVGKRLKVRVDAWEDGALLQLSRGAQPRLKSGTMTTTLHGRLLESELPNGLVSGAFRRRVGPGTTVARASRSSTTPALTTATIASGLTQAFIADPQQMLGYATFMVPFGTVFGEDAGTTTTTARTTDALVKAVERAGLSRARTSAHVPQSIPADTSFPVLSPGTWVASTVPVAVDLGGPDALDLGEAASVVRDKLDPTALLTARVRALVTVPASMWTSDVPSSMWADPSFPDPLYELLVKIDPELLLPGVGDIPDDTIALAEVSPAFVEAFLLGANHELVRELIWREYPADPAGTYLRTFWDSVDGEVEDIPRVAEWTPEALGTHQAAMDPGSVLVLVIKGELLRRYPSTLIYAVPATWQLDTEANVWERVEDTAGAVEQPIFVGSLGSDVVFLGFQFDVDVDSEVKGSTVRSDERPGWFFVFEQPPTEPRFGLDVGREGQADNKPRFWKNVSWYHALGDVASAATHAPLSVLDGTEKRYDDDANTANTWKETWGRSAAAMARITLQRPVRMLVHADQMLEPEEA